MAATCVYFEAGALRVIGGIWGRDLKTTCFMFFQLLLNNKQMLIKILI